MHIDDIPQAANYAKQLARGLEVLEHFTKDGESPVAVKEFSIRFSSGSCLKQTDLFAMFGLDHDVFESATVHMLRDLTQNRIHEIYRHLGALGVSTERFSS